MAEYAQFEMPTWKQIHKMLIKQSKKILSDHFIPNIIIAVTRGGWIPARLLSDLLEVHNITTIGIKSYSNIATKMNQPIINQKLKILISGKKILLVDDVADSGESLQLAKKHILKQNNVELKIATIYKKNKSKIDPDYYEKTIKNWIIFPWEIKETSRKLLEKNEGAKLNKFTELKLKEAYITKELAKYFLKK
ncbi:MAG: hypothetical protein AC479_05435 [miscellaneous Crenarchaeota group-6 archaeon AD8-1]|nr:MAG: hypothetical protein AC479_05435 [miscellaneous Crenarchaeota group-6 archaeon AD8-1]